MKKQTVIVIVLLLLGAMCHAQYALNFCGFAMQGAIDVGMTALVGGLVITGGLLTGDTGIIWMEDRTMVIIGIPAGLIFTDRGCLPYLLKQQFAHRFGALFPALEILFEWQLDFYNVVKGDNSGFANCILRAKYPLLRRYIDSDRASALVPFLEGGISSLSMSKETDPWSGTVMEEGLSWVAGCGLMLQIVHKSPIGIGFRYRLQYSVHSSHISHGAAVFVNFGYLFSNKKGDTIESSAQ